MTDTSDYAIVVPTLGRPSLNRCLAALARTAGVRPRRVVVVDDRPHTPDPLPMEVPAELDGVVVTTQTTGGRGPAVARNTGVAAAGPAAWVVFLDDDVEVGSRWAEELAADLARAGPGTGGVQGRLRVPLPAHRPPTDWERLTKGLEDAAWATADMAFRRDALIETGGFDERFPRAFREDADLALRVLDAGWSLARGERVTFHPVRPASSWVSLGAQRGNSDDVLMMRLHGRDWRDRASVPRGRRPRHLVTTALAGTAVTAAAARRPLYAAAAATAWLAATAEFTAARVRPGPRTAREIAVMSVTSAAIPPLATMHWLLGLWRYRHRPPAWPGRPAAVLFDRDGTLVHDVPYNGDPRLVRPMPSASAAVRTLREGGLALGVVSNQSGIGRGLITPDDAERVNREIDALLGPFGTWQICPHRDTDGCRCRKPQPGLIETAARRLGVRPGDCVVIGDTGADVAAARAAGARSILVPNQQTLPTELAGARIAPDLGAAAEMILHGLR